MREWNGVVIEVVRAQIKELEVSARIIMDYAVRITQNDSRI